MGHTRIKAIMLILALTMMIVFTVSIQTMKEPVVATSDPKFVIASWDYPDEYGQGILSIRPYENSSGSWVNFGGWVEYYESTELEFNASAAIKLKVLSTLNATLTGAISLSDGKNYFQHSVVVTNSSAEIFSQQNFTYIDSADEETGIYDYEYDVILNFISISGTIYTVNVDYEVFYLGGSGEYEASDQSINSFSETLPDDVLFYPDAIRNDTAHIADTGTGDYADSQVLDSTYWTATGGSLEEAEFHLLATIQIETFSYAFYGHSTVADGWLKIQNDADAWVILETIATGSDTWYNGTVSDPDYFKTDNEIHLAILDDILGDGATIECDYLEISYVSYMALADSNHYAESFADVSDWTLYANEGADAKSTDGDILSWTCENNGNPNADYLYSNTPSLSAGSYYFEIRFKYNTTSGPQVHLYGYTGSDMPTGGSTITLKTDLTRSTSWATYKGYILTTATLESVYFYTSFTTHVDFTLYVDYIRIAPADETGWQHDGSTTIGITSSDGGTITSDGNELSLISDADGSRFNINVDMTTTRTTFNPNYYPMLEIKYNLSDIGDNVQILVNCTTGVLTLQSYTTISDTTVRYNLLAKTAGGFYGFIFYGYSSQTLKIDYIKAYSIADYTYTGTGTSTDDVLFVSDGTLYCQATSITSMILDRDPAVSVSTSVGDMWSITTSSGIPQTDYYVNGAWVGYSSETEGIFTNGTLTDVRIKFTDSANIAAISFLTQIDGWGLVSTSTLIFSVSYDYWALNMGFIFFGLILMILCPCFAAKKVRDGTISRDVGMLVLVVFCVGWALFAGGLLLG